MDAVILCGGFGTRLQPVVADRPKALAPVAGRPFLSHLIQQVRDAGAGRFVLCTGYMGGLVRETFGNTFNGLPIEYSLEAEPLGTGGALRLALPLLQSSMALVMNGDSFFEVDFDGLLKAHHRTSAAATMALVEVEDTSRYGRVSLGTDNSVVSFEEKSASRGPGFINAGIYLLNRSVIESLAPDANISLEKEVFPALAGCGLFGFPGRGRFIDIGTPESFAAAETFFGFE